MEHWAENVARIPMQQLRSDWLPAPCYCAPRSKKHRVFPYRIQTSLIIPCDASAAVLVSTMASYRRTQEEVGWLSLLTSMIVMKISARYEDGCVGSDGKHCWKATLPLTRCRYDCVLDSCIELWSVWLLWIPKSPSHCIEYCQPLRDLLAVPPTATIRYTKDLWVVHT